MSAHDTGVPVINLGGVVDRRGDWPGRQRHRPGFPRMNVDMIKREIADRDREQVDR